MKLVLDHALPDRLNYLRIYAELGSIKFYLSLTGRNIQLFGGVAKDKISPKMFTDKQYLQHRLDHPVNQVLMEDDEEVVVETNDGTEERWLKPKWLLRNIRMKKVEERQYPLHA